MSFYCRVCNDLFSGAVDRCPRCGLAGTQSERSPHAETQLLENPLSLQDPVDLEIGVDTGLLDGQQIHIYLCQKMLGRGGMGTVYLARNQQLHRFCALKVLSPKRVSRDCDYVARFENEGRAAAALVHPNIVTTHAIGRWNEHHFLEMEYVAGRSLQNEIERDGPLGPIRSTGMAVGIACGLATAHRLGIVHRDLKPDNVLVSPASTPKIADFGLAKRLEADDLPASNLVGTPY